MGNSLTLLLVFGIILTAAGYLCKTPLLYLFGASDETIPYANAYMDVYLAAEPVTGLARCFTMMAVVWKKL